MRTGLEKTAHQIILVSDYPILGYFDRNRPKLSGDCCQMKLPKPPQKTRCSLPPTPPSFTAYDAANFTSYMHLLTLASGGASPEEIARDVFGVDPECDPQVAEKIVDAHLKRANWLLVSGYHDLFTPVG